MSYFRSLSFLIPTRPAASRKSTTDDIAKNHEVCETNVEQNNKLQILFIKSKEINMNKKILYLSFILIMNSTVSYATMRAKAARIVPILAILYVGPASSIFEHDDLDSKILKNAVGNELAKEIIDKHKKDHNHSMHNIFTQVKNWIEKK